MDKLNFHKLLGFGCQIPDSRQSSTDPNDPKGDFKAVMAWWQDMAHQNGKCSLNPDAVSKWQEKDIVVQRENAALIIQSNYRQIVEHRNYMRIRNAALTLQSAILAWLSVTRKESPVERIAWTRRKHLGKFGAYVTFMADRHYFVNLRKSIIVIQQAVRIWLARSHYVARTSSNQSQSTDVFCFAMVMSSKPGEKAPSINAHREMLKEKITVVNVEDRLHNLQTSAALRIQNFWKDYVINKSMQSQHIAATKIQSHYRGLLMRKHFSCKKHAIRVIQSSWKDYAVNKSIRSQHVASVKIQSHYRGWLMRKSFSCKKQAIRAIQNSWKTYAANKSIQRHHVAATKIQRHYCGWMVRKSYASKKQAVITIQKKLRRLRSKRDFQIYRKENVSAIIIQSHFRGWMARREVQEQKHLFIMIQSFCRGWIQRNELLLKKDATIKIQSAFRYMNFRQSFTSQRRAASDIQRFIRGQATRRRLLGASRSRESTKYSYQGLQLQILLQSVLKLQRWWRHVFQVKSKCAIVVQSYVRGWLARQMAKKEKQRAVVIQSYWKGYLARKEAKDQLQYLRWRMQKSAANVDDSKRLINRLVSAVSELLNMRSLSGILHTCATLDMATELSEKCCQELVAAGAVTTLHKLILSVSRSIPDQQILKHALSTLRNLSRHPSLACMLVESRGCVEAVLLEFLRNKGEGYFIASELLKRTCKIENGAEAIRKLPALLKRLNNFAEELTRKAGNDKRNARNLGARENGERRLKEAIEVLKLIKSS